MIESREASAQPFCSAFDSLSAFSRTYLGTLPPPSPALVVFFSSLTQLCTKGTALEVVETPIHVAGMQIATADDYCFDGARFRTCNDGDPTLR